MDRPEGPKDELQPTVRVMRLYRPNLHGIHQFSSYSKCEDGSPGVVGSVPSDFAISPYLLFPDSFSDIYCGETFSAYIAVVNGSNDHALQLVKLNIRLQTSSSSYDLYGSDMANNNYPVSVAPLGNVNAIVRHELLELGSYTLRVQVEYVVNSSNELKTIRKFYKFNVSQPMMVKKTHDCSLRGSRLTAQSTATNMTKAPLFIENISISDINFGNNNNCSDIKSTVISAGNSGAVDGDDALKVLQVTSDVLNYSTPLQHYPFDSAPMLGPNESLAYGVSLSNIDSLLNVHNNLVAEQVLSWQDNIKWYSYMCESGVVREINSSSVFKSHMPSPSNTDATSKPIIAVTTLAEPADTVIGKEFDVTIRIYNLTPDDLSLQFDANSTLHGGATDSLDAMESLHVVGPTCFEIPLIDSGGYRDVQLSLYATRSGLNGLKGILFTDKTTKKEYRSGVIFRSFVYS